MMRPRGRDERPAHFRWQLVWFFSLLDFFAVSGLYVFTRLLGTISVDVYPGDLLDRVAGVSEWMFDTLSLPMIAVTGMTWYGAIFNTFIHGFLAERLVSLYRQFAGRNPRAGRRSTGDQKTSNPERVGQTHAND
jgi:hypothetical protein